MVGAVVLLQIRFQVGEQLLAHVGRVAQDDVEASISVRPELVEGLQGFDRLSPNGALFYRRIYPLILTYSRYIYCLRCFFIYSKNSWVAGLPVKRQRVQRFVGNQAVALVKVGFQPR